MLHWKTQPALVLTVVLALLGIVVGPATGAGYYW
jgi:hypothetical protein